MSERTSAKIVDMRLRPPLPSWATKPQFSKARVHYPTRMGFPRPPSAEALSMDLVLQEMDEAGIRWGVCMGRQSAAPLGVIPNEEIVELLQTYPERFVSLAGVDVGKPDEAIHETERTLAGGAFRGISIEPGCATEPMLASDPRIYPIYARCQEASVPVSVGLSAALCNAVGYDLSFASPLPLHRVTRDFPDLRIIVSHAGWPFVQEMLAVAFVAANVYVSPDLYQVGVNMPFAQEYIRAANVFLGDRLLFGTAYPSRPLVESVAAFQDWPFEPGVKEKVLYRNAQRVLGLPDADAGHRG